MYTAHTLLFVYHGNPDYKMIVVVCVYGYGCNGSGIPNKPHDFVLALGCLGVYIHTGNVRQSKGAQNERTLDVDIYPCLLSCLVICVSMCDWKGCIMYASKCVYPTYLQCSHLLYIYFLPVLLFLSHIFSRHHPPFPSLAHNETIFKALAVFPSLFFFFLLSPSSIFFSCT